MVGKHREFVIAAIFTLSIFLPVFAGECSGRSGGGAFYYPPAPELISPTSEKVALDGEDFLELKWENSYGINTRAYDFRLYKGYDMYQKNLIIKQQLPMDKFSFKVDSSVFENGQVYTWSLRRITFAGQKSDATFSSFVIIKKSEKN